MSKLFRTRGARRIVAVIALLFLSSAAYSASSGQLLSFELTHDMLPTEDNFSVTVYEDGLALVHYPTYMTQAGDYAVELSASEIQQIRLLLEHPLVQGFNPKSARAQKQEIDTSSQELFEISDDSWSNFELQSPDGPKNIRWANLPIDAERYPEIGVFRKLADIQARLMQLDQHPTAQAVVD